MQGQADEPANQEAMQLINTRFRTKKQLYNYLRDKSVSDASSSPISSSARGPAQGQLLHPPLPPAMSPGREAHANGQGVPR